MLFTALLILFLIPFHILDTVFFIPLNIFEITVFIALNTVVIIPFIVFITVSIIPLIAFHTVKTTPLIAFQIPVKNVFIPSQALFQSPVKIPTIKSINPLNVCIIPPIVSVIAPNTLQIVFHKLSNIGTNTGRIFCIIQSITGFRMLFQRAVTASAILPIKPVTLSTKGFKCVFHNSLNFVANRSNIGAT